jgi:hypothetical protein
LTQTWLRTNFTERQNDEKDNNFIDIRLKKTDLAFFFNFSGLMTNKKCQSTETFHWLTDNGRDKLFLTFETLLFYRHRTKMDTDKNLDYYIYRLLDRHKTDYNGLYQIQVFFSKFLPQQ